MTQQFLVGPSSCTGIVRYEAGVAPHLIRSLHQESALRTRVWVDVGTQQTMLAICEQECHAGEGAVRSEPNIPARAVCHCWPKVPGQLRACTATGAIGRYDDVVGIQQLDRVYSAGLRN